MIIEIPQRLFTQPLSPSVAREPSRGEDAQVVLELNLNAEHESIIFERLLRARSSISGKADFRVLDEKELYQFQAVINSIDITYPIAETSLTITTAITTGLLDQVAAP